MEDRPGVQNWFVGKTGLLSSSFVQVTQLRQVFTYISQRNGLLSGKIISTDGL